MPGRKGRRWQEKGNGETLRFFPYPLRPQPPFTRSGPDGPYGRVREGAPSLIFPACFPEDLAKKRKNCAADPEHRVKDKQDY